MKSMKKFLAAAVSCALVSAIGLTGCTGSGTSSSSSESSTSSAAPQSDIQLQVFAANSLEKAMNEAQELYTQQTGVTFADTQYDASGTLNEKLKGGAYADVLITASKGTMDTAIDAGYVDEATNETMFTNDLVIVTQEDGALANIDITLEDIAAGTYTLSVGDENVPAGNYACQALSTVGAYVEPDGATGADATGKGGTFSETLQPKVTLGDKVGSVCKYAESGEVDIAMVYSSDVYRFGGVSICSVVPNDTHKAITYPGAICADSNNVEAAQAFLTWCMTDEDCAQIWQKWGFELA